MKLKREVSRTQKQDQADERQAIYDSLTSDQKLAKRDKRLGKGIGAVKERKRLQG